MTKTCFRLLIPYIICTYGLHKVLGFVTYLGISLDFLTYIRTE